MAFEIQSPFWLWSNIYICDMNYYYLTTSVSVSLIERAKFPYNAPFAVLFQISLSNKNIRNNALTLKQQPYEFLL